MSFERILSVIRHPAPPRGAMSVDEFLQWAGISRWMFYQLVKRGLIHPKKIGTRTVVPVEEAERWLRELPESSPMADTTASEEE